MKLLNHLDPGVAKIRVREDGLISLAPTNLTPRDLETHVAALAHVASAVPDWVWREYESRRADPAPARRTDAGPRG